MASILFPLKRSEVKKSMARAAIKCPKRKRKKKGNYLKTESSQIICTKIRKNYTKLLKIG